MLRLKRAGLMVLTVMGWMCITTPAAAEWVIDLYGGGIFTTRPSVSITKNSEPGSSGTLALDATLKNVKIDTFGMGGLRLGYWFDTREQLLGFDLGLGLDMFYYPLRIPRQTVDATADANVDITTADPHVIAIGGESRPVELSDLDVDDAAVISPELLLRRSFFSNTDFPQGRLQPYLSIAPAFLFTHQHAGISVGVKSGIGISWQFHKHLALLAEYRFTHVPFATRDASLRLENTLIHNTRVEADLKAHFVVAGISLRFK